MKNIIKNILKLCLTDMMYMRMKMLFSAPGKYIPAPGGDVFPVQYNQDGLVTCNTCNFMNDDKFIESYQLGAETGSWKGADIHWRVHVACWAAYTAKTLQGDYVECGVYKGGLARAVISYIDFPSTNKKMYLIDTYTGLVEEQLSVKELNAGIGEAYLGRYESTVDFVRNTFAPYNVEVIQGIVPDVLSSVNVEKVCYLSIDMNCAEPEVKALDYFWDKIVTGGIVILDDYSQPMHVEQRDAIDRFCLTKNSKVLSLPTGQGLIVKSHM